MVKAQSDGEFSDTMDLSEMTWLVRDFGEAVSSCKITESSFIIGGWNGKLAQYSHDGDLLWEMDIEQASCPHCDSFHQPHYIALSLAVIFSEEHETTSSTMTVDYVRLIDNGFAMVELI